MLMLRRTQVVRAMRSSPWDFTNRILYDLCRRYPDHKDQGVALAKILLIGRVYAAAIERRRSKEETNDDFYITIVEPKLRRSRLDQWLEQARAVRPNAPEALDVILEVHGRTTRLFRRISGLEKRSLASKYLHFHVPRLFYIYDSRAAKGLRSVAPIVGRASRCTGVGDNEYRKFVEKCRQLREYCEATFGLRISPQQLDNLLLALPTDET